MAELQERRYTISEVADLTQVSPHVLRQWEKRVGKLRPKRTRAGRRYYEPDDVELVRLIKYLMRHKGMKLEAISRYLNQEDYKKGVLPKSPDSALELVRAIAEEVRQLISKVQRNS
jgi:DNA-binding transcriptional MerR regulator